MVCLLFKPWCLGGLHGIIHGFILYQALIKHEQLACLR